MTSDPTNKTLGLIESLIAFDSTSHRSNLDLIHFIADYLDDLGVASQMVFDETGAKANIYATIGPTERPGVMLSGHTDVVPVKGQDWSHDPFQAQIADRKVYGRGASDMKSFIAVTLAAVPRFLELKLQTPVHLAFSYDEEIGCIGVRRLIDTLNDMPVKPAMCVVGEPTGMKVVTGHKGNLSHYVTVRGFEAHSSLIDRGVNAVEYAARLIAHIRTIALRFAAEGPFATGYDVPYTTVHTGVISGGTQLNIIPASCVFEFEIRHLPADDPDVVVAEIRAFAEQVLEPEMQAVAAGSGFSWELRAAFPGLDTGADEDVVQLVKSLTGQNDHTRVAFGTEAGLFQKQARIPAVVCGPGDIGQAHKPDEFITFEQIVLCEQFMARLGEKLAVK